MRPFLLFLFAFFPLLNQAQNVNVTHRSTMTFANQNLANIWGYASGGNEYALVGAKNGLIIVNVTDPDNPVEIVQIPGPTSDWHEIKTYQHYAYVVSEGGSIGIQVVDLSNLPSSNLTYHNVTPGGIAKAHALHVDETKGYLYVYGSNLQGGKAAVFNLNNDPYNPVYVNFVNFIGYVHDGYVDNDLFYPAHVYQGKFGIVNMANKNNPILLGSQTTPGAFTHNTWKSGNALFTTDEVSNSYLTSYDVSDPTDIKELDRIRITPGSGSIVHNTHVMDNYAVTSWYKDGFSIIDVARPANIVETGRYDTYPNGAGNGFEGCWGVYPYFPSGNIVASNIRAQGTNNGEMWVFTPNYTRGCYLEGVVTDSLTGNPINGASVVILSSGVSGITNALGEYKIAQLQDGTVNVSFSFPGYVTKVLSATLTNGVLTVLDVALAPPQGPGGGSGLPVELVSFEARSEGREGILVWKTASEINNAGFEVQQSRNNGHHWVTLGFVPAQGDGKSPATYTFRVPGLEPGAHLFRLRQIDHDGSATFSPWRTLTLPSEKLEAFVWPNPVAEYCRLRLRSPQPASVLVEVLGADLRATGISIRASVAEETIVPLDLGSLPAGNYHVVISDGQERVVVAVVKR
ncbi:MAG: choice-of-anchor B family protein [Saprospiraceae bacterium]|nr:choice-of-anchor B family protein [Saprospiraceae bacterium]